MRRKLVDTQTRTREFRLQKYRSSDDLYNFVKNKKINLNLKKASAPFNTLSDK